MRHTRFTSFTVGVVAAFVVGITVTEVAPRWIFFSLLVGILAVTAGILIAAVTMRSWLVGWLPRAPRSERLQATSSAIESRSSGGGPSSTVEC